MKVATVVAVAPTVTANNSDINSDVDELTVKGTGFDAGAPQVVLNSTAQIL